MPVGDELIELVSDAVGVVVDLRDGVPVIAHWGRPIGGLAHLPAVFDRPVPHGGLDVLAPLSIVAEHGSGHLGRPGMEGHRPDGSDWAPQFRIASVEHEIGGRAARISLRDDTAALALVVDLELHGRGGVLGVAASLTNEGATSYQLDALRLTVPLPGQATETLTFSGRHTLEFQPQRRPWPSGSQSVEGRTGRTSHDRVPVAFAGTPGFSQESGEVWGVHLAWSGSSAVHFDANGDGQRSVQCGELLLSGEITLAPGDTYRSPTLYGAYSASGLNGVSQAFHDHIRAQPNHPRTPRPVTLNTWEALFFDHSFELVARLADRAAAAGIERFVLDDGWFHARRDDRAGLGDWWVDPAVWPDGLGPIIEHVTTLGMQFGLWFEPEMVNPDSDLYRAHPDWVLADHRYPLVFGRYQLVLDLARPEVSDYLFEKIDAVLGANDISYVKWDMNRELVHASHDGRASVHGQTLALYALLQRVRDAHRTVEIESCASGGGRTDMEILRWTNRFWTSDSNDALDRQAIQRGFSHLFPPELMGAHIGPEVTHTTGRRHSLAFRAATAFFGHLGVEWNILELDDLQVKELREVVDLHKRFRPLLHGGGRTVRFDHPNPSVSAHGVVRDDGLEALVSYALMSSPRSLLCEPLRIAGLVPDTVFQVSVLPLPGAPTAGSRSQPRWLRDGLTMTGGQLAVLGLQPPVLFPETALLVHIRPVGDGASS